MDNRRKQKREYWGPASRHPTMRRDGGGNSSSACREWGAIKGPGKPTILDWPRWGRIRLYVGQVQRKIPFGRGHHRQGDGVQVEGGAQNLRLAYRNTKWTTEDMGDCVCACPWVVSGIVCGFPAIGGRKCCPFSGL